MERHMEEISYFVVRNLEAQYSIWRDDRPVPAGWEIQGEAGTLEQCMVYIRAHWTDMTPASLRQTT